MLMHEFYGDKWITEADEMMEWRGFGHLSAENFKTAGGSYSHVGRRTKWREGAAFLYINLIVFLIIIIFFFFIFIRIPTGIRY